MGARSRFGWRRCVVGFVAAGLLLSSPQGAAALPSAPRAHDTAKHHVQPMPRQRTGSADGRSPVVGSGHNDAIPPSFRSRYPLNPPVPAKRANSGRVVAPKPAAAGTFNPSSSHEVVAARTQYERSYANADGTTTTQFSPTPLNYQDALGRWQPVSPRLQADPAVSDALTSTGGGARVRAGRSLGAGRDVAVLTIDAEHEI